MSKGKGKGKGGPPVTSVPSPTPISPTISSTKSPRLEGHGGDGRFAPKVISSYRCDDIIVTHALVNNGRVSGASTTAASYTISPPLAARSALYPSCIPSRLLL